MQKIYIEEEISSYRINNNDIRNIEKLKHCILPAGYKEFLLKYNGGSPNFDTFEIKNDFPDGKSSFDDIRFFLVQIIIFLQKKIMIFLAMIGAIKDAFLKS